MILPLKYNIKNVLIRWRSTLATVLGVALVVAVYVMVQALAVGLEKCSANTGDPRNMMIVRKGSTAESSSVVTREQYQILTYMDEVSRNESKQPLISADVIVLVSLPRKDGSGEANVLVRGVSPLGPELRPQVSLVAGRWFVSGKREVVVSRRLAERFAQFQIGNQFRSSSAMLTVVGWMDGSNTAFDSEIWMPADDARQIYEREHFSSVLARVNTPEAGQALIDRIEMDKRLPMKVMQETQYYSSQTMTALPIKILGNFLAMTMSIGAVFAAMNTMYASVGARTWEIGTLRVLGYRRRSILAGFLIEGAFLAFIGGVLGCLLALPMHGYSTGTMSFETFGETVFQFRITFDLAAQGVVFSVCIGLAGSFLPALRASRLPVISALKAS